MASKNHLICTHMHMHTRAHTPTQGLTCSTVFNPLLKDG